MAQTENMRPGLVLLLLIFSGTEATAQTLDEASGTSRASTIDNEDRSHFGQNTTASALSKTSLSSDSGSSPMGSSLPSTTSGTPKNEEFEQTTFHLTDLDGWIPWQGDSNSTDVSWVISLNASYGIMLKVDEVYLDSARGESLVIYRGPHQEPSMEMQRLTGRVSSLQTLVNSSGVYATMTAVLFVPSSQATVLVTTQERRTPKGEEDFPRVLFSYTAVPMNTVPPQLANGRYNCSTPHEVPEAWRCDLARQCDGGEDEENFQCDYNGRCGKGNVAFEEHCLRFVFPLDPISPAEARRRCNKLLSPQDLELIPLVARVTSLNGYEGLIVDVSRVQTKIPGTEHLYRFLWQWGTFGRGYSHLVIYGQPDPRLNDPRFECGTLRNTPQLHLQPVSCWSKQLYPFVCSSGFSAGAVHSALTTPRRARRVPNKFPTKQCSDDSYTHRFHPCPDHVRITETSGVTDGLSEHESEIPDTSKDLPKLECQSGDLVDYSLACDAHDDCGDGTDEDTCDSVTSLFGTSFKCTRNAEIISSEHVCDGIPHCHDGTDEEGCMECKRGTVFCEGVGCVPMNYTTLGSLCLQTDNGNDGIPDFEQTPMNTFLFSPERIKIDLDGYGMAQFRPKDQSQSCPEEYFQCQAGLCIPVYLVNNRLIDCPLRDYDTNGDRYRTVFCPGYYRCYGHEICLHNEHLCDGVPQCPLKDDERYCDLDCPRGCSCQGLALTCHELDGEVPYWTRYLDVSGVLVSQNWLKHMQHLWYLQFLNLSSCGLYNVSNLDDMIHVTVLDLSFNHLTDLTSINIQWMKKLAHFNLSHNPVFPYLEVDVSTFFQNMGISNLLSLVIQDTGFSSISPAAFTELTTLKILDLRENRIGDLHKDMFAGLGSLENLYADDPKLCCSYFYDFPDSQAMCHAPEDELSSCDDLLRSDFFRGFLWTLSVLAVTGNVAVLIYRLFLESVGTSPGFRVLVANLCLSDLLMGVYLMVIGSADAEYRGTYLWAYEEWTHSAACKAAGFLAFASCEVSAFLVCLITLDRLIMLQFPLKPHLHLTLCHIVIACVSVWVVGAILAAVPLLPLTAHWEFYSQTGICLPLPITQQDFPGQQYAFGVFIVLNFVIFLLIGSGQLLIYRAIRSGRMTGSTNRRQQDMAIARRLFFIVFSDFCCWFPIGLMGLLAAGGTPIPGVVNVWSAIFVLPLNSALNPFLYTLATLLERRRKRREAERVKTMLGRVHIEISSWPQDSLEELLQQVQRALKTEAASGGRVKKSEWAVTGEMSTADATETEVIP